MDTPTTSRCGHFGVGLIWSFVLHLVISCVLLPQVHSMTVPSNSNANSNTTITDRGGRCPETIMETRLCGDQIDQCTNDQDCSGDSLCCSTGCNRVCILPAYTACEQVRLSAERRARSLEEAKENHLSVQIPECDASNGKFKEIQCSGSKGCYCVDEQGFELPGTRARALEAVNCSAPSKTCEGPMCRMLCPYGFELDSEGCEICECRNICKGVQCPGSTTCEMEEAPCTTQPCPPVASCKGARSLESLCTYGAPLTIPESGNPFLCGNLPGQPSCPAAFECNVKSGNDYGVCCASNRNFEKPGSCPVVAITKDSSMAGSKSEECISSCRHDLDCSEFDKCCISQGCGKQCTKPANSTACLQQRHIAELLSQKELEGKGYIPQCDGDGNFIAKQCSRNGKVCWCVGPDGKNYPQSIGPSENVNCNNTQQRQRASLRSDDSYDNCDKIICSSMNCEYGFKTDRNGCATCDCIESPCDFFNCPADSKCQMITEPNCHSDNCAQKPSCLSENLFVNPCPMGTPLTDVGTTQVVACSETAPTCPSSHICVLVAPNKAGLCCANRPRVEPTKPGMCPFLSPSLCNTNSSLGVEGSHKKCSSDNDCGDNSMKCCAAGDCTLCADPLLHQDIDVLNKQSPTMCQYLRDATYKIDGVFNKFQLAKPKPHCKEDSGEFNEIQCDDSYCMCVDEYGAEIPGTMMKKEVHNLTASYCLEARHNPKCLEMNCRLACDYGYETLDGCRICECRNPCMLKNGCGDDEQCEMVDIDCWDGHCPPLPFCIPKILVNPMETLQGKEISFKCVKGTPFISEENNETLTCNPRARMLQCPDDYFCHDVVDANELGLCCPILSEEEAGAYLLTQAQERKEISAEDQQDGNYLFGFGGDNAVRVPKPGQCPYLIPIGNNPPSSSCESECEADHHCPKSKKCCLNSCGGSQCTQPLLMTACQHQKSILEHKARESGQPSRRVFIPECDELGEYVRIQSFAKFQWCVDSAGQEIQGTRVPAPEKPNCLKPSQCPQTKCSLQCEFGLNLDTKGCPVCQCKPSPCETDVHCGAGEECRMMQLNCISDPCPPVPLCLPRLDNPCSFGAPLSFEESGDTVPCGSGYGSCPSSHKCNVSPFGEYAVCCPKPKEVCFEAKDIGSCKAMITKWFFNSSSNECQPFYHSGCGGNNNQFNSKAECLAVCPALTHCERIREKNMELVQKYKHMSYIPRCDPRNGEWESTQCFPEVGMCWCVNKKGDPVKGTMTSGMPNCQARRGRLLATSASASVTSPSLVCPNGVTVHKCSKDTCENKMCLGYPDAKCMINPCGGCHERWISSEGIEVNCNTGLGQCHRDMQQVMNSNAWLNQGHTTTAMMATTDDDDMDDDVELMDEEFSTIGNALSQLLLKAGTGGGRARSLDLDSPHEQVMTRVTPIFIGDVGGHRLMGIMSSSSVTIMGGGPKGQTQSSSEEDEEESREGKKSSSPVRSIADILADMMTSQSRQSNQHHKVSYLDGLMDLMQTSSQQQLSREMLPPLPLVPDFAYGSSTSNGHTRGKRDTSSAGVEEEIPDSLAMESSISSSSSEEEQRHDPTQSQILMKILPPTPMNKEGECPKPTHFALFNLLTGNCGDECHLDRECKGMEKCCLSKCGMKCVQPIISSGGINVRENIHILPPPEDFMLRQQQLQREQSIPIPTYEDFQFEAPTMMISLPQCNDDGEYKAVQTEGDLSWCVTPQGVPIQESFTRGKVNCDNNGTIRERYIRGPICPDPLQTPMVCKDQCLHSSCPLHPDAICVMDVCDECRPSYYTSTGEKVRCEEKCQQPMGEPGFCRASILRYTFNGSSGRCEEFIYGGCNGNENNFEFLQDCQNDCEKTDVDICNLSVKSGPCRASMTRYFFNAETQFCEEFDYGGCGGNANNFMSREHCMTRCPDIVLCPEIQEDGQMKSCSRMEACGNITCPNSNLQFDDYICTVDPCTCTATLKDFNGNLVNCDQIDAASSKSESSDSSDAIVLEAMNMNPFGFNSNQLLQVNFDLSSYSSRCLNTGHNNLCDSMGQFEPMQCPTSTDCICVDEAGNKLEGTESFLPGTKTCKRVPIKRIEVSLNFPVGDDVSSVQLGVEMQDVLRSLSGHLEEDKLEVEVLPGSTNLKFSLIGPNKIDVGFILEKMVIGSNIGVLDQGKFYPADFSNSRFRHEVSHEEEDDKAPINNQSEDVSTLENDSKGDISLDDDILSTNDLSSSQSQGGVSAESLGLDDDRQNTIAALLTLVAAISACLIVLGLFLAMQKKKSTGSYPKKPFESLAFSSQIYEIEKKMIPKGFPTFKVVCPLSEPKEKQQQNEKS